MIDKTKWGAGPWQEEPDRVEFHHTGLPCLLNRNSGGAWCGYAAVPPGHPLHGVPYNNREGGEVDVEVHGGLTYSGPCQGEICHKPAPGEPDNAWWFGFDCAHMSDFAPGFAAHMREHGLDHYRDEDSVYRTLAYARSETQHLAEQLAHMGV